MTTALKTRRNRSSVRAFLSSIHDERRGKEARVVSAMMTELTGEKPAMWGSSMVGFGSYHHRYASGQEGDWPLVGFSPRKDNLTLYAWPSVDLCVLCGKVCCPGRSNVVASRKVPSAGH